MKLAIMQPYIFPYIGYFQLINAVDKFIFYDDVTFIKQGWINRNRILLNERDFLFSVPIKNISSNRKINETEISLEYYEKWLKKFMKIIDSSYKKAPNFLLIKSIIEKILNLKTKYISELAIESVKAISNYLGIDKTFEQSSQKYYGSIDLSGSDRLVDICKKNNANHYINPIGGKELYKKEVFFEKKIELSFLYSNNIVYKQFGNKFIPNLSIIDVLMFNSIKDIREILQNYTLI